MVSIRAARSRSGPRDGDIGAARFQTRPSNSRGSLCPIDGKADNAAALAPVVETRLLSRGAGELLIKVKAAAVNPSDVKAATGLMPYAVFPRTPAAITQAS